MLSHIHIFKKYIALVILCGIATPFAVSAAGQSDQENPLMQEAGQVVERLVKKQKRLQRRFELSRDLLNNDKHAFAHIQPIISDFEAQELQLNKLMNITKPVTMLGHTGLSWMSIPVADQQEIKRRQAMLRALVEDASAFEQLQNALQDVSKGELALLRYWDTESKFNKYINDNFVYKKGAINKLPIVGSFLDTTESWNNSSVALEGAALSRLVNLVVPFTLSSYAYSCLNQMAWQPSSGWNLKTAAEVCIPSKKKARNFIKSTAYGLTRDLWELPLDPRGKLRSPDSATYAVYDYDQQANDIVRDERGSPKRVSKPLDQMGANHIEQVLLDGSAADRFRLGCDTMQNSKYSPYAGYALGSAYVLSYAALYYWLEWGWFGIYGIAKRGKEVLTKMQKLHRSLSEVAALMRSLNTLDSVVAQVPALHNSAAHKNLQSVLDKSNWSKDLRDLMDLFATGTFDNPDAWVYSRGRTLRAYNLLKKVKDELIPAMQAIAEFDAYFAIAQLYKTHQGQSNRFVFADFVQSNMPQVNIDGCWTPLVPAQEAVMNDVRLGVRDVPVRMMITGPNGGGKSTFLKSLGHAVMMAQSWGIVPAQKAQLTLFSGVRTSLDPREDISRGISTFMAQKERIGLLKEYVKQSNAQKKMLIMLDEPYRGTTDAQTEERICEFGNHVARLPHAVVCIATHVKKPVTLANNKSFANYHVEIQDLGNGKFKRLFKVQPGVANKWLNNKRWASQFVDWLDTEIREKAARRQGGMGLPAASA